MLLQFTNEGSQACSLRGFPTVTELRGSLSQIAAEQTTTGSFSVPGQSPGPAQTVSLAPGRSAEAVLEWADNDVQSGGRYNASVCPDFGVSGFQVSAPGTSWAEQIPAVGVAVCRDLAVQPVVPVAGSADR